MIKVVDWNSLNQWSCSKLKDVLYLIKLMELLQHSIVLSSVYMQWRSRLLLVTNFENLFYISVRQTKTDEKTGEAG